MIRPTSELDTVSCTVLNKAHTSTLYTSCDSHMTHRVGLVTSCQLCEVCVMEEVLVFDVGVG